MTTLQRLRRKAWFQWACAAVLFSASAALLTISFIALSGGFA